MERLIAIGIALFLTFYSLTIICPLTFFFVEEIIGRNFFAIFLKLFLSAVAIVLFFIGTLKLGEKILVKKC